MAAIVAGHQAGIAIMRRDGFQGVLKGQDEHGIIGEIDVEAELGLGPGRGFIYRKSLCFNG